LRQEGCEAMDLLYVNLRTLRETLRGTRTLLLEYVVIVFSTNSTSVPPYSGIILMTFDRRFVHRSLLARR